MRCALSHGRSSDRERPTDSMFTTTVIYDRLSVDLALWQTVSRLAGRYRTGSVDTSRVARRSSAIETTDAKPAVERVTAVRDDASQYRHSATSSSLLLTGSRLKLPAFWRTQISCTAATWMGGLLTAPCNAEASRLG